jgi:hypothetical protein
LSGTLRNDRKLLQQCRTIFDGLHSLLGQRAQKEKAKRHVPRQPSRQRGRSPHR